MGTPSSPLEISVGDLKKPATGSEFDSCELLDEVERALFLRLKLFFNEPNMEDFSDGEVGILWDRV
jgi:hypothetical protein